MFQLLGVEATKAQKSFDTTVISKVQKVGSIVPLEIRIYAVWSLNIEGGNILYNSICTMCQVYKKKESCFFYPFPWLPNDQQQMCDKNTLISKFSFVL